jgi:hypothetical protein
MGREAIQLYDLAKAAEIDEGRKVQQRCIALDRDCAGSARFRPT